MIYRVYAQKDTTITNYQRNGIPQTGSNVGSSEILDLFKLSGVSGSTSVTVSASVGRVLMRFDLTEFMDLTGSGVAPATGSSYFLKLRHAQHGKTLPFSYDVQVAPISTDWDEGRGLDLEDWYDKGFANWVKPKSNTTWVSPGGDFSTILTASYHFDTGYEDLEVDITPTVNAWLTGGLPNFGVMIRLTGSIESDLEYNDYYIKKFHARNSNFLDKRPYIELRFDDTVQTGSLDSTQLTGSANYVINVLNLKTDYEQDEKIRFNLFVRKTDYNPPVLSTGSLVMTGITVPNMYYRIENDSTREHVIPFGTGSVKTTRLSYGSGSNYFNFYMKNLQPGNLYKLVFMLDIDGQRQIIDNDYRFRVK